jgi:hypothetical protein
MSKVAQLDSYTKLVRYLETHNGRDKICRLLQYGGRYCHCLFCDWSVLFFWWRFVAWSLVINNRADEAKKFQTLEETSSLSRKVFRLGKSLSLLQVRSNRLTKTNGYEECMENILWGARELYHFRILTQLAGEWCCCKNYNSDPKPEFSSMVVFGSHYLGSQSWVGEDGCSKACTKSQHLLVGCNGLWWVLISCAQ